MDEEARRRPPTMRDIASVLGVTVTTVSKSLRNHPDVSPQMRRKVLEAADTLNYVPNTFARGLRSNRSTFVPVLITDIANPYFSEIIDGVESVLRTEGYDILIFDTKEKSDLEISIISKIIGIKPAGVILTPARSSALAVPALRSAEIPYVLTNRYLARGEDNYVVADDMRAAYLAAQHLITRRSSNVIFVNGSMGISCAADRLDGYRKALSDYNVPFNSGLLYGDCNNQKDGYNAAKDIFAHHKPPLSVLAYSDFVASGVLRFALEAGLEIPGEVAVMGIDNIDLYSFAHPSLSTVTLAKHEIGAAAANLLLRLIGGDKLSEEQIVLGPELVVRESA